MQALTETTARQGLGGWLKKTVAGEQIGVLVGDPVVAFRPVPVVAADYAKRECGLISAEANESAARILS